jgi:alpha-tubulin suppressor-like RCC1 family protein
MLSNHPLATISQTCTGVSSGTLLLEISANLSILSSIMRGFPTGLIYFLGIALFGWLSGCSGSARAATGVITWGAAGRPETLVPPGLSNVIAISAGTFNSLALKPDGTVVYWGNNVLDPYYPTNCPPEATNAVAVSAGYGHNLVLRRDGTVVAWGNGTLNATGLEDFGQSVVPAGLNDVMAISAGTDYSLALRSNHLVVAWGVLSNVPPGLSNVTCIAAAPDHALALRGDGTVALWRNEVNYNSAVTNIPAGLSNVIAIAGGDGFSLALRSDGTVIGWGLNFYGELSVPAGLSNVVGIGCGYFNSLAIRQDGTVVAWGAGGSGSNSWPSAGQCVVPFGLTNVSAIDGGYFDSMVINDGSPVITDQIPNQTNYNGTTITFAVSAAGLPPISYQWRHNGANIPAGTASSLVLANTQLADAGNYSVVVHNPYGSVTSPDSILSLSTSVPLITQQPASRAVLITSNCLFALKATGSLPISFQWRLNGSPIPGANAMSLSLPNVQLSDGGGYDVVLTNLYGSVTSSIARLAVTPSIIIGWGNGSFGQTNHPSSLTNVIAVSAGSSHSMALQQNGVVLAWGGNDSNQTNVPPAATNATAIAAGANFCVALRGDGQPVAWGDNYYFQTNVPAGLSNVVAISASDYHTLAVKRDGTLAGWGYFVGLIGPFMSLSGFRQGSAMWWLLPPVPNTRWP